MVKGEVSRIKHHNPATGFCVFVIRVIKGEGTSNNSLSCAGNSDNPPEPGSVLEVYGRVTNDGKWGPQMKYTAFHVTAGFSAHSIVKYLCSFAKFLGPKKASAIAEKFGTDLENILDKDPDRLLEVDGIGKEVSANILEGWRTNRSMHTIKIFLTTIGLKDYQIKQIAAKHGPDYDALLKKDPYVLMYEGIGFSICDEIARKLKIGPQSETRVRGLIINAIRSFCVMGEGHLYITKKQMMNHINDFNDRQSEERKIDPVSVTWDEIQAPLEYLKENGFIVQEEERLYLVEHFFYESKSAELLSDILNTPGSESLEKIDPDGIVSFYEKHEQLNIPDFKFSERQEDAIKNFIKEKVLVVTGPPGTGKTTVIKTFVRILDNAKVSYCLLAPTGIASKRLEQTSNQEASTIHRKLGYRGRDGWTHNSRNPINEEVIIVDEFSMVDMELFYRIVSAVDRRAHIVFVGDVNQLPSVGPGNVLKDLIRSEAVPTVELDKVHRQAEQSDIIVAANRIKNGDTNLDLFKRDIGADICYIPTNADVLAGEKAIKNVCKQLDGMKHLTYQVITPRNEGELSVASINELLQESLNPPGKYPHKGSVDKIALTREISIRPGDKVMVIKNNYNLGVFNGDVGKVRLLTSEVVRIDLLSGDSVAIPIGDARQMLKLAYAATVHKVQGTEFSVCVIPLLKSHGKMLLQRNLLYTALTRARKKVIVIGQSSAIEAAIENSEIRNRSTFFAEKIRVCLEEYLPNNSIFTGELLRIKQDALNFNRIQRVLNPSSREKVYQEV